MCHCLVLSVCLILIIYNYIAYMLYKAHISNHLSIEICYLLLVAEFHSPAV